MRYDKKDIFNSAKPLENRFNQILYAFIGKNTPYALPNNVESYVNDGYCGNVNIYPVIRKIVDATIGVEWELKDRSTDEEAVDQTLMQLLRNPNSRQSMNEFIDEALVWRLITGNRYIYWIAPLGGPNAGKPAEMHLLPASEIEIVQGDWLDPVGGYKMAIGDVWKILPKEQVIHGKKTNIQYDLSGTQLYGMSPLQAALKVMSATNTGYDQLVKNFENGGPDVIITETEAGAAGVEYSTEQRDSIWERFVQRFRNKSKERFLIKRKPVEVHELGKSPVDLNIIEFMKMSLRDYCNIYNVPVVLLNDNSSATYNNVKEATKALWNNAVIPELEYLKEDLNKLALVYNRITGQDLYFEFFLDDIPELQEDKTTLVAGLSQAWWLTPDEKREAMDMDPLATPEMQTIYAPMGIMPMSEMLTPTDIPTEPETAKWYNGIKTQY
jgi:HK97 family phage portal protein